MSEWLLFNAKWVSDYLVQVLYLVLLLFDIFVYFFMYTLLRCLFSNTCWKGPGGSMS
jgi:heme O synthase-like polyprenyltransferase